MKWVKIQQESRFAFGRNWNRFLRVIDRDRMLASVVNLRRLLKEDNLEGKTFLDIGCGSGLSSLAAIQLGAKVHGFDYDQMSVKTSKSLMNKFSIDASKYIIERGSVLDSDYMKRIGQYDIVYSWGVLHHTGSMWDGINYAANAVKAGGKFALALYNDQGGASRRWLAIKKLYANSPSFVKVMMIGVIGIFFEIRSSFIRLLRFQNPLPFNDWKLRGQDRGMSVLYDLIDWVGGYPFEVARPEAVLAFLREKGFMLESMKTCAGGHGCNEFLFIKM